MKHRMYNRAKYKASYYDALQGIQRGTSKEKLISLKLKYYRFKTRKLEEFIYG